MSLSWNKYQIEWMGKNWAFLRAHSTVQNVYCQKYTFIVQYLFRSNQKSFIHTQSMESVAWHVHKRYDWYDSVYRETACALNRHRRSIECMLRISGLIKSADGFFMNSMKCHFNGNFPKQILNGAASTLTYSISTIYGYFNSRDYAMVSATTIYVRSSWLILYMSFTVIIIYYSNLLANEVKFRHHFDS